jgi:ADP-heptose:LPS heptosyltransferase
MMPPEVWGQFLRSAFHGKPPIRLLVFGSAINKKSCIEFIKHMQQILPGTDIDNLCGEQSLAESVAMMLNCDEFWAVDSGLLHIARVMVTRCRSFWGPTAPHILLRPVEGLQEIVSYHGFACSPCVHVTPSSPCKGNNLCMKTLADPNPDRAPLWLM